jgi:hypothetical protein
VYERSASLSLLREPSISFWDNLFHPIALFRPYNDHRESVENRKQTAAFNLDKDEQPCFGTSRLLSWIFVDGCPFLSTENPPEDLFSNLLILSNDE